MNTNYENKNSYKSEDDYNNRHIKEESEECEEFDDLDEKIERTDKYVDNDEDVGNDKKMKKLVSLLNLLNGTKKQLRCKCISAMYVYQLSHLNYKPFLS